MEHRPDYMPLDVLFDIYQMAEDQYPITCLRESSNFKVVDSGNKFIFSDYLDRLASTLKSVGTSETGTVGFHLIDMGAHRLRIGNDYRSEAFYSALDKFSEFLTASGLASCPVTICGKMTRKSLSAELRLFEFFFRKRLRISLASAFWRSSVTQLIELLDSNRIGIQVMLDVEGPDDNLTVRSPLGPVSLEAALQRFDAISIVAQRPIHLHLCSIRRAGLDSPDFAVLDYMDRRLRKCEHGDIIYSGGLPLDISEIRKLASSFPTIQRFGINNAILRHSAQETARVLKCILRCETLTSSGH